MRLQTATMMLLWFSPPPRAALSLSLSFLRTCSWVTKKEPSDLLFILIFLMVGLGWINFNLKKKKCFLLSPPLRENEVELYKSYNYVHLPCWKRNWQKCFHNNCFTEGKAWQKHWASYSNCGLLGRENKKLSLFLKEKRIILRGVMEKYKYIPFSLFLEFLKKSDASHFNMKINTPSDWSNLSLSLSSITSYHCFRTCSYSHLKTTCLCFKFYVLQINKLF